MISSPQNQQIQIALHFCRLLCNSLLQDVEVNRAAGYSTLMYS